MVYSSSSTSSSTSSSSLTLPKKVFRLFNIKTGEMFVLNATVEQLTTIVVAVIKSKYQTKIKKLENDYVETAKKLFIL
jgi:hypothetical protein